MESNIHQKQSTMEEKDYFVFTVNIGDLQGDIDLKEEGEN